MIEKKISKKLVVLLFFVQLVSFFVFNLESFVYALDDNHIIDFSKNETVYGVLSHNGEVEAIYVVNHIPLALSGTYVDYGAYKSIENLSNLVKPEVMADVIKWDLEKSHQGFYYQGELLSKELPWVLDVRYYLNGKEVDGKNLGGVNGIIEIVVDFSPKAGGEEHFIHNYFAQIQIPINLRNTKILSAEGASKVILGETATLAYTVLPNASVSYTVSLESSNFQLDGINIAISPFTLADALEFDEISKGFSELKWGMNELHKGTLDLQDGMYQLSKGINEVNMGQQKLKGNGNDIISGMDGFSGSLHVFHTAIPQLVGASRDIKDALDLLSAEGEVLREGVNEFAQIGINITDTIGELILEIKEIVPDIENDQLLQMVKLLVNRLDIDGDLACALERIIEKVILLEEMFNNLKLLHQGINEYTLGVEKLAEEYAVFHSHMETLPMATEGLTLGFDTLMQGNTSFIQAIGSLGEGLNKLSNEVDEVPKSMDGLILGQREMRNGLTEAEKSLKERFGLNDKSDYTNYSFVSPGKSSVDSVQFILKTPSIDIPVKEQHKVEVPKRNNFLDRLLKLFKRKK